MGTSAASNLKSAFVVLFLLLSFAVGTCPDLELLVRLPFQDMKLGQQTR
jgi:hypothetical protein